MCWECTSAACWVVFSFDELLHGPCCLENFPFLPREAVGEPLRGACISSLGNVCSMCHSERLAVVPQLWFEGWSKVRLCSCASSFQRWCEGMKGMRWHGLNILVKSGVWKCFVALTPWDIKGGKNLLFNLGYRRYLRFTCRIRQSSVTGFWWDLLLDEVWVEAAVATVQQSHSWLMAGCSLALLKHFC